MNDNPHNLPVYNLIFDEAEMAGVYAVSLVSDPAIQVEFLKFSAQEIECNCSTTDTDFSDELIDSILLRGEKIDLNEWELLDEKTVENEHDTDVNFANVVSQSSGDGSEDNEIFKVRYDYTPSATSANSRNFCKKMASSGLSFKKDDLVNSNANPGFGPAGASNYNIFLYKGGVNCKHSFSRKIYFNKNNKKMSVFEALKEIGKLNKSDSKKAKLNVNPPEVSQVAGPENNYWRLSSEEMKFSNTSIEKRILTSPVLIPEQLIYRNMESTGECYVKATSEVIEQLQQNFFKNQYQKNSTIEHNDNEIIDGVFFFESWLVSDPKMDKCVALGFSDLPKGTWMMSMKLNQNIWDDYVKTGKVKGFSIDSRLGIEKSTKNNNIKMNYSKVKEMVMAKILLEAQLAEFKIDDALTVYAEALEKDMVVFDKDKQPMANVSFALDGKNYETDENGVIVIIEDVAVEEKEVDAADVVEDVAVDAPDNNKLQDELDIANKRIADLEIENQSLKAEMVKNESESVKMKDELVKLASTPKVEGINLNNVPSQIPFEKMTPLQKFRESKK